MSDTPVRFTVVLDQAEGALGEIIGIALADAVRETHSPELTDQL